MGKIIGSFPISWGLLGLHAQETNVDSDLPGLLQAVEQTPAISAEATPRFGTFWSAQHAPGTDQPWPPLPSNARRVPLWDLGDNTYLLSDFDVDYSASSSWVTAVSAGALAVSAADGLIPSGSGTNAAGFCSDSFHSKIQPGNEY